MSSHTEAVAAYAQAAGRDRAATYRYKKLSEWFFDFLFAVLLNFGQWVTSLAWALRAGYECFHERRAKFARSRLERPPVWMIDEETANQLQCPVALRECPRTRDR